MPQLEELAVNFVSFVPRAAVRDPQQPSEPRRFLVWKGEGVSVPDHEGSHMATQDALADAQRLQKEAEDRADAAVAAEKAVTKERDDLLAKATSSDSDESEGGDGMEDELDEESRESGEGKAIGRNKSPTIKGEDLSPAALARIAKAESDAQERIAKAEASAKEANEIAKAEQDRRVTSEFIAKAEDYRSLPIDAARFGPILKSAFEKLSKDEYAELERVLAAADEQITKGDLFKQYGDSGPGGTVSGAFEQLEREATALKKSDPSLSDEQALEKAMEANPDLERQYAAEQG